MKCRSTIFFLIFAVTFLFALASCDKAEEPIIEEAQNEIDPSASGSESIETSEESVVPNNDAKEDDKEVSIPDIRYYGNTAYYVELPADFEGYPIYNTKAGGYFLDTIRDLTQLMWGYEYTDTEGKSLKEITLILQEAVVKDLMVEDEWRTFTITDYSKPMSAPTIYSPDDVTEDMLENGEFPRISGENIWVLHFNEAVRFSGEYGVFSSEEFEKMFFEEFPEAEFYGLPHEGSGDDWFILECKDNVYRCYPWRYIQEHILNEDPHYRIENAAERLCIVDDNSNVIKRTF